MTVSRKSRKQLKDFIARNAFPSKSFYSDFVDAALNKADDGVSKLEGGPLVVSGGLTVSGGVLSTESGATVNGPMSVSGNLGTHGLLVANAGATVTGGPLTATSAINISMPDTTAGSAAPQDLLNLRREGITNVCWPHSASIALDGGDAGDRGKSALRIKVSPQSGQPDATVMVLKTDGVQVTGPMSISDQLTASSLTFPAPKGDPAGVITCRAVPAGQFEGSNTNEISELILWQGNDGDNGCGPDLITLRAPGIRLQTFNDARVDDINNPAGSQTRLYIDPKGTTTLSGPLNFRITHPTQPGQRDLVHGCLEGPESAVYYRGEGQLLGGMVSIELPLYFEALTRREGRSVQLTPVWESTEESIAQLASSQVRDGHFSVRATDSSNPSQRFFWEVKAVRADLDPLEVEPPR